MVGPDARAAQLHQKPFVVWLTGIPGAGKSTIAGLVERELHRRGKHTYLLDGDHVRQGLSRDLGFGEAERLENIRRVAEVAKCMVDAGLIVIVALISPFRAGRRTARALFADGQFVEVFVDAPLAVAQERDPKRLYTRAGRGELMNVTGIDSPYEPPDAPELRIETAVLSADEAVAKVLELLQSLEFVDSTSWKGPGGGG
jgi:bifunctional enzyme CysN/CysC